MIEEEIDNIKEESLFKSKKDLISHYYVKAVGFAAYLSLIALVSCSSAYLNSQVQEEIHTQQEQVKERQNTITMPTDEVEIIEEYKNTPNGDIYEEVIEQPEEQQQEEVAIEEEGNSFKIALVIDDCGVNQYRTKQAIEKLPKEVTLSYLPYAKEIQSQVDMGKEDGHEIMLHIPMEAVSYNEAGENTLLTSWDDDKLLTQTKKYLDSFDGYIAVNNHTGSKFTQNKDKMTVVLNEVKARNLAFLDSVTIGNSVAYSTAKDMEIPAARRNIFIDHSPEVEYIYKQLLKAEDYAKNKGTAIVIGHPRTNTITALELWIPTLEAKNIELIPVSKVY